MDTIQGKNVQLYLSLAGTNPLATLSTGYAEVLGVDTFAIDGASKDVELKRGFAASDADGEFVSEKETTEMVTIELTLPNVDQNVWDAYFGGTNYLSRTTDKLAFGITATDSGAAVHTWVTQNAYVTNIKIDGKLDDIVSGSVTLKTAPSAMVYTKT